MSRTLIEIYFCVRYISNKDTEARAATYANYHARVRQEWQTIIMKYYLNRSPPSACELDCFRIADDPESSYGRSKTEARGFATASSRVFLCAWAVALCSRSARGHNPCCGIIADLASQFAILQ
ncbi:MAG: hypothetical protein ACHP8A_13205 [Terriglobales bacterium]